MSREIAHQAEHEERLMDYALGGAASPEARADLTRQLGACAACMGFGYRELPLLEAMEAAQEAPAGGQGPGKRLAGLLEEVMVVMGGESSAGRGAGVPETAEAGVLGVIDLAARRRRRARWTTYAAAACVTLIVGGAVLWARLSGSPVVLAETRVERTTSRTLGPETVQVSDPRRPIEVLAGDTITVSIRHPGPLEAMRDIRVIASGPDQKQVTLHAAFEARDLEVVEKNGRWSTPLVSPGETGGRGATVTLVAGPAEERGARVVVPVRLLSVVPGEVRVRVLAAPGVGDEARLWSQPVVLRVGGRTD